MSGNVRRSSTVFDVVLEMRRQVAEAPLPSGVEVTSMHPSAEEFREGVSVAPNIDDTFAQWRRMGPAGRDETYRVDIVTRVYTPGLSDTECTERLRDITHAIESIWHDPASRSFSPPDVPGVQLLGGAVGTTFTVLPAAEGWQGTSTIRFEITARI